MTTSTALLPASACLLSSGPLNSGPASHICMQNIYAAHLATRLGRAASVTHHEPILRLLIYSSSSSSSSILSSSCPPPPMHTRHKQACRCWTRRHSRTCAGKPACPSKQPSLCQAAPQPPRRTCLGAWTHWHACYWPSPFWTCRSSCTCWRTGRPSDSTLDMVNFGLSMQEDAEMVCCSWQTEGSLDTPTAWSLIPNRQHACAGLGKGTRVEWPAVGCYARSCCR